MEEIIKHIISSSTPEEMWKPMGLLIACAFLLLLSHLIKQFIAATRKNLDALSVDMADIKRDLSDLVGVSKLHEYRISEAEDDIKVLQEVKVKYKR